MEKVEIRAVNKYLCKKGMSPKDIHDDFMDTLWKKSPSYSTVKKRNLKAAGKAVEMLSSLCGQKRQPTMKHDLVMCDRMRHLQSIARIRV
jgi:hypothetical protein